MHWTIHIFGKIPVWSNHQSELTFIVICERTIFTRNEKVIRDIRHEFTMQRPKGEACRTPNSAAPSPATPQLVAQIVFAPASLHFVCSFFQTLQVHCSIVPRVRSEEGQGEGPCEAEGGEAKTCITAILDQSA